MASNFDCLGLGSLDRDSMNDLLNRVLPAAELIGQAGDVAVHRWTDPSGVRLVVALRDGRLEELLPSFSGVPGARLAEVRRVSDEMIVADVVDDAGEQATMLAAASEQLLLLPRGTGPISGRASLIALGVQVTVHADEDAFAASDASLLSGGDGEDGGDSEPPAHFVENGWTWPPRMGAESFISYGAFDQENGDPIAQLNGIVLSAERRVVAATGGEFSVARVRSVGFEADLCLPGDVPTPAPGNVIGGVVYLIADLPFVSAPAPAAKAKRSWWRR
ncbi:hypothetical protein QLQ12_38515 [Actinoplanes sp. NEAU-A12]|uniref:Uncharacterized protein n=1 Tax=Actinoplanes sandaracinus TaxID=3045177 RepID=A0ABT6WXM7_9ACTN|nr:hypothetical protein [Actinoplanes sandaracinus]MDI6104500.1 hypothetical protein [Actinoplanes sandaracinus]